jgi:predicted Zn-dependent protease
MGSAAAAGNVYDKIERELGRQVKAAFAASSGLVEDPLLLEWVRRIGGEIAAAAPRQPFVYDFSIADLDEMNAFALPGGFVFVTRGLLDAVRSDDELAGVIAHEVGHVHGRDGMRQIEHQLLMLGLLSTFKNEKWDTFVTVLQLLDLLGSLKYSRQLESRADRFGAEYSYRAGYDPAGLSGFFNQLLALEKRSPSKLETILATHPPTAERLAALQASEWLDPRNRDLLLEQGDRLREGYRLEPARAKYTLVLEQGLDGSDAAARLAEVYALAGRDEEAREAAARALARDPENTRAKDVLAQVEARPTAPEPSLDERIEALLVRQAWRRWVRQSRAEREAVRAESLALAARLRETQRCHTHNDWLNDATLAHPKTRDLRWWLAIGEARALMLEIDSTLSRASKAARGVEGALTGLEQFADPSRAVGLTEDLVQRLQDEMGTGLAELCTCLRAAERARRGADRAARLLTPVLIDLADPYNASPDQLSLNRLAVLETAIYAAHRYVSESRAAGRAAVSLAAGVQDRQWLVQLSLEEGAAPPARRELYERIAARRLGMSEASLRFLRRQGYMYGEAVVLLALHRSTDRPLYDLEALRQPDEDWIDLAARLDVDLDALRITLQMLARHLEETRLAI